MKNCFDLRRPLLAVLAGLLSWPALAAVVASEAWVREVPPSSPVAAAFVTLANTGSEPVRVTAIESPLADKVHWHDMVAGEGMLRMQVRARIVLAPASQVTLAPGASHLMLLGLKKPLAVGDRVPLTLRFDGQPPLTLTAVVRRSESAAGQHTHHH